MQTLPRLPIFRITGFLLLFGLGTVGVLCWILPAQAQTEPDPKATKTPETQAPTAKDPKDPEKPAPPKIADPEAEKLFKRAAEKLPKRMYKAKIVQRLAFPDRTLEATGRIVRGPDYRIRLEFQIQAGKTTGELLQVCDGDLLWTQRRVNDVIRVTEQDVKEILRKSQLTKTQESLVKAEMGLGGVTALLASLNQTMVFGKPQTEVIDGEEFLRVEGEWNAEFHEQVKRNPHLAKGLSIHIPDEARVYFDRDDFPRRIQYLKQDPKHKILRPVVTLDFLDVKWLTEAELNPAEFQYQKPDRVPSKPVTDLYLQQLKQPPGR